MTFASAVHVPVDSTHTPPGHSLSFWQPRQALVVESQTGAWAVHAVLSRQPTHAPLVAQYGLPAMLVQSPSLPHAATQTSFSQNGIVESVQSAFVVHCGATHNWFTHNGADASVQSALVVHIGATHAPVELQTCVPSHGVMPDKP